MPGYEAWQRECRKRRNRLTVPQVADGLGVSVITVKRWIERGWLTASVGKRGYALVRTKAISRAMGLPQVQRVVAAAMLRRARKGQSVALPRPVETRTRVTKEAET